MNKGLIFGIIGVLIGGAIFFYWSQVARAAVGNLNIYNGTAEVFRDNEELEGKTGSVVRRSDVVKVGSNSRASIILKDGSAIRLEAESEIEILKLVYSGDEVQDASFRLISGKVWSKVRPLSDDANWQVETPTTVASVRGTSFNTRYTEASTGIGVYEGSVGVALITDRENEKLLNWGESFSMRDDYLEEDFAKDPIKIDSKKLDDWVIFNIGEDKKIDDNLGTNSQAVVDTVVGEVQINMPGFESQRKLSSLTIYGYSTTLLTGKEVQLKVRGTYSDSTTEEIPATKVKWTKDVRSGTISSDGFFSSQTEGVVSITAELNGVVSQAVTIEVKNSLAVVKRIDISYAKIVPTYTYYNPNALPSVQLQARAIYDDNSSQDVTDKASWSVSGTAGGSVNPEGLYTPAGAGSITITARFEGKSAISQIAIP